MKLFLQKNAKFSSLRRLGALPPNPQPPAAGGFAPRPPLASGGFFAASPQKAPPPWEFLATRLSVTQTYHRQGVWGQGP